MNTLKITTKHVLTTLIFLSSILAACDTGNQDMMHGSTMSGGMGYWNWVLVLISIGFGFLLGWIVAKRKK